MKYLLNCILKLSFSLILNSKIIAASTSSTFCDQVLGVSTESVNEKTGLDLDDLIIALSKFSNKGELIPQKDLDVLQVSDDEGMSREIYNLGVRFQLGLEISANFERAYSLFLLAASLGHACALNNLGVMHYQEESVPYNPEFALLCCSKAADLGVSEADYNIALYYLDQNFIHQDISQAADTAPHSETLISNILFHLIKAAKQGHQEAKAILLEWQKNPNITLKLKRFLTIYAKAAKRKK